MNVRRRALAPVLAALVLLTSLIPLAQAQDSFPSKPITLIVPFPPGGMTDPLSRNVIATSFQGLTGQPVVVVNRPGAAGMIGAAAVASAPADGYTLLFASSSLVLEPALRPSGKIDVRRDLAPIGIVGTTPFWVVVNGNFAARSMKELVDIARSKPGLVKYGTAGVGSSNNMAGELFQRVTGTKLLHVPYQGSGPAKIALAAGDVDLMFDTVGSSGDLEVAGRIRALAISGPARVPERPNQPTKAEAGFPDYSYDIWLGLFAPAGTPKPIIARLHSLLTQGLKRGDSPKLLAQLGTQPFDTTPEDFEQRIKRDVERWITIVKDANIKVD